MTPRPLFLLGVQRSGTTFAARLLSEHPACRLLVNGKVFYYLNAWVLRDPSPAALGHLRLDEIAHGLRRRPILGVSPEDADRIARKLEGASRGLRTDGRTREDVVRAIWEEAFADLGPCSIRGEKYNEYILQLRELAAVFPDAKYLLIHRDPLDVAESMLRSFSGRPWCPKDAAGAIVKWAAWHREWLAAKAWIPAARRLEIAYASLSSAPQRAFLSICRFLEIEPSDRFLSAAEQGTKAGLSGKGGTLRVDWGAVRERAPDIEAISSTLGYARGGGSA